MVRWIDKKDGNYRKTSERRKRERETQAEDRRAAPGEESFLEPAPQPLPDMRTSAGIPAALRAVPAVLPATGAARRDSRGLQVVLVRQLPVAGCQLPVAATNWQLITGNWQLVFGFSVAAGSPACRGERATLRRVEEMNLTDPVADFL